MAEADSKDAEPPKRRHLSAEEKRRLKAAEIQLFAKQHGRKAQKGVEPNDRRYRREIEEQVKRMSPDELNALLRDEK